MTAHPRLRRLWPVALTASGIASLAVPRDAAAFGGTAPELERQGNFVITNDAGLAFDHAFGGSTTLSLRPALDYFVINNLSIGGAVELDLGPGAADRLELAPEIGVDFALSGTWSFWPQASTPIVFPLSGGAPAFLITVFAPFLIHPAEHFFFGAGPGLTHQFTGRFDAPGETHFTIGFVIGGYFDH